MSCDARYMIQYEGPFGEGELEADIARLNENVPGFGFKKFGYDILIGETKHAPDEVVIASAGTPLQILRSDDSRPFWEEIYRYTK